MLSEFIPVSVCVLFEVFEHVYNSSFELFVLRLFPKLFSRGALTMGLAILTGDRLSSCIAYVTPARRGHLKLV